MSRTSRILLSALIVVPSFIAAVALAEDKAKPPTPIEPTPEQIAAGSSAFADVARVLQSPRCMNCHPAGDKPLQTDASTPHALGISRQSAEAGLACATCHQSQNSDVVGIEDGPPGAPNWHLPPKETPMVFEGRSVRELCEQLKTPEENGGKTLQQLMQHVAADPLVLWGWKPGGDRTLPPLTHQIFVARFATWVQSGGACPN